MVWKVSKNSLSLSCLLRTYTHIFFPVCLALNRQTLSHVHTHTHKHTRDVDTVTSVVVIVVVVVVVVDLERRKEWGVDGWRDGGRKEGVWCGVWHKPTCTDWARHTHTHTHIHTQRLFTSLVLPPSPPPPPPIHCHSYSLNIYLNHAV